MSEKMKRNLEQAAAIGLSLVGTAAVAACNGTAQETHGGVCYSPRAYSDRYVGDADPRVTDDPATYMLGVEADVTVRPDIANREKYEVVASFGDPEPHTARGRELSGHEWKDSDWKDSLPIDADHGHRFAFAIGRNPVRFSVMIKAANGSPACDVAPTIDFRGPQEFAPLKAQGLDKNLHF